MFTQPSVNQIEQAYTGNYQPLAAKVEQDKKQHGGIPQDLRQLLALNDLISNQNSAGIQQALNAPVNMPTVAQNAQQQAQQILQARMMQQAQQPHGIDSIPTDVGSGYANGGIIGDAHRYFDGDVVVDPMLGTTVNQSKLSDNDETLLEKLGVLNPANRRALEKAERDLQKQKAGISTKEEIDRGREKDPRADQVKIDFADQLKQAATVAKPAPEAKPALFRDTGAMPAAAGRPSAGLDAYLATPENNLRNVMNVNPDETIKSGMDIYNKNVGSPSTVGIDRMMAELERRKAKLEGQEPKPGLGGLMDYLENIANAGGRHWYEAGTKGAMLQKANQKAREEQINALIEKGIDLAQKKEDVAYGVKKEAFNVGLKEREDAIKRKYDSAIALSTNDLEREKLKQQRDLELRKIAAMHVNPALQIAAALQGAKTPEQKDAIMQGIAGVYGNKAGGSEAQLQKQYNDAKKEIDKSEEYKALAWVTGKEKQALEAKKAKELADLDVYYATQYNIGPLSKKASGSSGAESTGQVKFLGYEK